MIALWQCKGPKNVNKEYSYSFFKQITEELQEFYNPFIERIVQTNFYPDTEDDSNLIYIPKEE